MVFLVLQTEAVLTLSYRQGLLLAGITRINIIYIGSKERRERGCWTNLTFLGSILALIAVYYSQL